MNGTSDWREWEELWRADRAAPGQLEALIERTRRARRALRLMRVLPTVLALIALVVVAAALRHAGNALEVALGVAVSVGIVAVWAMELGNRRDAGAKVEAALGEYVATRRALCGRQIRFARLALIVTLLDLVFLVPWWIGGFRVHGAGFHAMQLLTMWGPLGLMAAFVWWTLRLSRRARSELRHIVSLDA